MNALSVADADADNLNGNKTLLANGLSTFPIKGNPVFSDGPKSLPKNLSHCLIFCNWIFDNFLLVDESFAKALLKNYALVNNNIYGKLFSSLESPTTFDEIFKVTSVPFFIHDFDLLSCELDNFTFKRIYWVYLY